MLTNKSLKFSWDKYDWLEGWPPKRRWTVRNIKEILKEIYLGEGVRKIHLNSGKFPAVKCGDVNSKLEDQFFKCLSHVDLDLLKRPKFFWPKDILIGNVANCMEALGKCRIYLGEGKCIAGNDVIVMRIKDTLNSKFIHYQVASQAFRKNIGRKIDGRPVIKLDMDELLRLPVAVPDNIEVQNEIVDFLDTWLEVERFFGREINNELKNAKNKQYQFFRNSIFEKRIPDLNA